MEPTVNPTHDAPSYRALALQTACQGINPCRSRSESQVLIDQAIDRVAAQIRAANGFFGGSIRLVVLPEVRPDRVSDG